MRATVVQRDDEFGADAAAAGDAWDSERTAQWLRGYVCSRDGDVFQLGLPHPDVADGDELEGVGADAAALVRPLTHASEELGEELKAALADGSARKAAAAAPPPRRPRSPSSAAACSPRSRRTPRSSCSATTST